MSSSLLAADTGVLNTQVFYNLLDRLMGASIGVIAVHTREANRGKLLVHQWASMRGMDYLVWDAINQMSTYRALPNIEGDEGQEVVIEESQMREYLKPSGTVSGVGDLFGAFDYFRQRETGKENEKNMAIATFVGIDGDALDMPIVQQHIRDHVQRAYQCNDRIIMLLTPGTVIPDAIKGDVEVIDLPTPSYAELGETFDEMAAEIPDGSGEAAEGEEALNFNYVPDDDDRAIIVQNGLGMTSQEFENAMSLAIVDISAKLEALGEDEEYEVTARDFVKVVRERKLEVLKQTNTLELMPEAKLGDVGGLDLLKAELDLQKDSFTAEAKAFGIQPPKGFLVVGPPGTGKSLICSASSYALGVAALKFDMSSVYGSLVGSSEQKMRETLKLAEQSAPCILFIDEIDKAVGTGSGNDGGTTGRVFGTLLTWMQEKQTKGIPVIVIASANNVDHIPPELLRKGRFDDIWSVSYPSDVERAKIFQIHIEKRGHRLSPEDYRKLGKRSNEFVGAEIEAVVEQALRIDFRAKQKNIQVETLLSRIDATRPQARVFPERIEAMRKWCEANARASSSGASFPVEPIVEKGKTMPKPRRATPLKLARKSSTN